jgi:predicted N-formylglutamate amidohydrolase
MSAGVPIPGNRALSPEARRGRVEGFFRPYHEAIDHLLDGRSHGPVVLLSIHSFTPVLHGEARPWQIGVSYWRDPRLATLLIGALEHRRDLVVGNNQPYPIEEDTDYTIPRHGEGRGLPSAMIEIRQDKVRTGAAAAAWAARLDEAYRLIETKLTQRLHSAASG